MYLVYFVDGGNAYLYNIDRRTETAVAEFRGRYRSAASILGHYPTARRVAGLLDLFAEAA